MRELKRKNRLFRSALAGATAGVLAVAAPLAAQANTAVNPFTPAGQSWVDVPSANRVYFEPFGHPSPDYFYDDRALFYVPAGISCTYNFVTATGPMYVAKDTVTSSTCHDSASAPYDPTDTTNRANAASFGFTTNFFGTNYSSGWPNTNGGLFFDQPSNAYNSTVPYLVGNQESTAIFPLSTDQQYSFTESNFWSGNTTIDGHNAIVFSWENFVNNGTSIGDGGVNMSYQLVLIDLGNGDFDAWFNYDSMTGVTGGYDAAAFWVDLETGVTVGSNVVTTSDASFASEDCTSADTSTFGNYTDPDADSFSYFKRESSTSVSLWDDISCTVPANVAAVQDVANDGHAYVEIVDDDNNYYAVTAGWGTYNATTGKISWTELLRNLERDTLVNGGSSPLIAMSWNTTVPGRFVLGQRGGSVVDDPSDESSSGSDNSLADTGSNPTDTLVLLTIALFAGLTLTVGSSLVARKRTARK